MVLLLLRFRESIRRKTLMNHMDRIAEIIEEEIDRRVNERINVLLEYISNHWDISLAQLTKDVPRALPTTSVTQCMSVHKKSKQRCKNRAKSNGFCHMHQAQHTVRHEPRVNTDELVHTHTLPPLFMKGCPVCERANRFRDFEDIECT